MKIANALALIGLATCVASVSADAKDWKTVRFGMDATYAPFESVDPSGKIVGFEVDYANALCAKMHVTCTFQNQDWDGVIPALLSGKFDVIFSSTVSYTHLDVYKRQPLARDCRRCSSRRNTTTPTGPGLACSRRRPAIPGCASDPTCCWST